MLVIKGYNSHKTARRKQTADVNEAACGLEVTMRAQLYSEPLFLFLNPYFVCGVIPSWF